MALTEWNTVEYILDVMDEVTDLEKLDHELCRFVFRADDPGVTRPVQTLLSGDLSGAAIIAMAQVSDENLNEAVAATEFVPLVGLGTIAESNWFLKSGTFKSVMDVASLRNLIFSVAMAHNHYSSLVEGNQGI